MGHRTVRCVIAVATLALSGCAVDVTAPSLAASASRTIVFRDGEVGQIDRLAPSSMFGVPSPGVETYACDAFGTQWVEDWTSAFVGVTTYREATYKHQFVGTLTFYPGAQVANGTNTNSLTYLGACNGDMYGNTLTVNIDRRIGGVWATIATVELNNFERFTFASGIPAQYRGRAGGTNGVSLPHFGVGAAWNITPLRKVN